MAAKTRDSADKKAPFNAHTFGAICAYDGWRAGPNGVGRVVTDATWRHFINLNLVGGPPSGGGGFPVSPEGRDFPFVRPTISNSAPG